MKRKKTGGSDSDGSDDSFPSTPSSAQKKYKPESSSIKKKGPKSSSDLCEQFGLNDVATQYNDTDYQNLTNYGLFVRMVRPQVQEANPNIPPSRMAQIMEAKWREFRESNPVTRKRREEEERKKDEEKLREEQKREDERKKKAEDERERMQLEIEKKIEEKKTQGDDEDDDDDEEEDGDGDGEGGDVEGDGDGEGEGDGDEEGGDNDDDEEGDDSDSDNADDSDEPIALDSDVEEEAPPPKPKARSTPALKIKLPLPRSADKRKVNYEEKDRSASISEDESYERRSRRQPVRKKQTEFAIMDSDDSDEPRKKRTYSRRTPVEKKKQEIAVSDDDFGSQEASSSEDITDDEDANNASRRGGLRKHKKKKHHKEGKRKPVIPGERKSSRRSHGGTSSTREISDREFEKLMRMEAKEKALEEEAKAEKVIEKAKKKKKRPPKPVRADDDGDDSDHFWYCAVCRDGGDLLLCDGCPRSFHQACIRMEDADIPDGDWKCPKCTGKIPEGVEIESESSEEEDTGHDHFCKVCKDGGDMLLCDSCVGVYHLKCLNPPLKEPPKGRWVCPRCITMQTSLKGWVVQVLTWKWSKVDKDHDELDHIHSPVKKSAESEKETSAIEDEMGLKPERFLFVKYKDYSYWECDWIREMQYEIFHPLAWAVWKRKNDMDEPPPLEDGSSSVMKRHRAEDAKRDDPLNLYERFYKWGVKPEWLQVDRVVTHDRKNKKTLLVKWKDLSYEIATWEDSSLIPVENFHTHVDAYWSRRKREEGVKPKEPKPKKAVLKKKLEEQPSYITETGGKLHPYQLEGLNWMRFSWAQDTNIILADEMGLGKTIQAISFIYALWKEGYTKGPFLLSVPLSTLLNWEREFAFWAPEMYVLTYIGSKENRCIIREHEFCYKEGAFHNYNIPSKFREAFKTKFDVLLTSYEYVSMDKVTLSSIRWNVLIIDEAHRLKNQSSLFFRTLTEYKIDYKLLLTGTPLQNNLEELFNLLNFLEREKFDDIEGFLGTFADVSKEAQVARLHEMLAPHMLRRLKIDVFKDIPPKTELIVRIELSPLQKQYYKHILTKNYSALNVRGHSASTSLMNIMMDLRKCCNHPYLFPSADTEAPISRKGYYEVTALINACGKLLILSKMLRKLKEQGHRVLIFSQMTRVLDVLEDFCAGEGHSYERIDGSVMGSVRQSAIDRFNDLASTCFIFLLSTKAGGLGINLATADTVIIYDMDWNPHNDIQAFSRAHRIGQKNKVMIYRFVSKNSVEEKMTEVCKKKMMLTELVVRPGMGSEKADSLSKSEVNDILKFGAEKLFSEDAGTVVYDDEMIEKLLDRDQAADEEPTEEDGSGIAVGLNDYLRSFKVASYQVKETIEEEEEEDNPKEEEIDEQLTKPEDDPEYWKRILGSAYEEHQLAILREQELQAERMGKGKRTRRKVNYAEALYEKQQLELLKKTSKEEYKAQKEKESEEVVEGDMDKEKDEEYTYMSDYEPDSSDSEPSSDEEFAATVVPENSLVPVVKPPTPLTTSGKSRPSKKNLKEVNKSDIPPLLARVQGQIEVLGFTPRQRRAFMDAIMRYGLPPDDCYKSQWLVRDLKNKTEKVFKAYVSLFMRHLCEPVGPDIEKFSDGTPREGLSRQHVLTRIGMMALIRKKVHEYENGHPTDSLIEFGIKVVIGSKHGEVSKIGEEAAKKPDAADKMLDISDSKSNGSEKGKTGSDKTEDEAEKKSDESSKMNDSEEKTIVEESKKDDSEKNIDSSENKSDESKGKQNESDKSENSDSSKMDVDESEGKTDTESKAEGTKSSDINSTVKEENDAIVKEKTGVTAESDKTSELEKTDIKKEVKLADIDSNKEDNIDDKDTTGEKSEDKSEKVKSDDISEVKSEPKSDIVETEASSEENKKSDKLSEDINKTKTEKTETIVIELDPVKRSIEDRQKRTKALRKKFYIADGGFTDIQNLWNFEENLLKNTRNEYEVWHRRHDYWLLVGIINHGYRHWQDILNDPRFEILNKAFRNDSDKMRKGAFLNRRFQLLEQALVIEEQLKRELRENISLQNMLPAIKPEDDHHTPVDKLAEILRKLIKDGHIPAGTDPYLIKILVQIENLVGDIRQATYSGMPATIAKSVNPTPHAPPPPKLVARPTPPPRSVLNVIAPSSRPPPALTVGRPQMPAMHSSSAVQELLQSQSKSGIYFPKSFFS